MHSLLSTWCFVSSLLTAKVVYALKIYLFRLQSKIKKREANNLLEFNLFPVLVYMKAWFYSPSTIEALYDDLLLVRRLREFNVINKVVCNVALKAFKRRMWYLGDHLIMLSSFSDNFQ